MEYGRLESFGAIHFERAHSVKTSRSRILLRCDHRDKVLATDNLNQGDARQLDVVAVQLSPVAGRAIWLRGSGYFSRLSSWAAPPHCHLPVATGYQGFR